jgi:hypothetical protein
MKRREFITLLGAGAAAWPLAARAQRGNGPVRLGFLPLGSPSNAYDRSLVEAFQQGLRRVGLIENRDIILDVAWVTGDPDQAVSDVLRRGAELLIPCGSSASVAAKRQTTTIPIVFLSVGDPIAMGLVESLPRPGRNATGFSDILADPQREVGGPLQGAEQAANNGRLSLAYRMAGRSKSLPGHRAGCPGGWNEAPVKWDRRHCRAGRCPCDDETERLDDARRSAEPVHLWASRTDHRLGEEEWTRDDISLSRSPRGRVR